MKKKTRKQIGIENFGKKSFKKNLDSMLWELLNDKDKMNELRQKMEEFDTNQKVIPFNVDRTWPEGVIAFNKEYALTYSGYEKDEAEHYIWPWLHDFIMILYHIETIYEDGALIIDAREDKENKLTTERVNELVDDICTIFKSGKNIREVRDQFMQSIGLKKVIDLN